jgi:hypothetical protein
MDLINGLENGFCHTWVTGNSKERNDVFKNRFKQYVDEGKFIRDIQSAPRDARYKIDYYLNAETSENDTVPYPFIGFHLDVLKFLNIDESFNWKNVLKDRKSEYTHNDFTLGYGDYSYQIYGGNETIYSAYYFKHNDKINTLKFSHSPKLVDYSDKFWAKYKDKEQYYDSISDLLHNIKYYIKYNGICL